MIVPLVYNPQAPPRSVMSQHAVSPPPQQQYHHDQQRQHQQQLQYHPQHHHAHPQFYQQPVPCHSDPSFSGHHQQQQQPQQQQQQQQHFPPPCASSAFTAGTDRVVRAHAISPSAFHSDYRPGTQVGWPSSSGAANGLEGTATLAAATASRFLACQALSKTMLPSASQCITRPPASVAVTSSPDHAPPHFSSEPLIVSGPAGNDGGRGRDVAPASHPYSLKTMNSGEQKRQRAPRGDNSGEEQSKRTRTPEAATTAAVAPAPPSALDSKAFKALNAGLAASTCQPGREGARVGLLPGLRPEYMQTYETKEKKRRAPREDLSTLTAEEKVERRKVQARVCSHQARKRDEAKMQALAEDVDMMQVFRRIVEDAPDMMAVVSPDLDCTLLYANEAFERVLGFVPHRLLGRPLWALVHPEDHPVLKQAMMAVILAPAGRRAISAPLSCRLATATVGKYVSVKARMSRGTQGFVCCFGEKAQ